MAFALSTEFSLRPSSRVRGSLGSKPKMAAGCRRLENELMMSAVELEGLAYLSFFDDGCWFQVNFCFIPVTVAIEDHAKFQALKWYCDQKIHFSFSFRFLLARLFYTSLAKSLGFEFYPKAFFFECKFRISRSAIVHAPAKSHALGVSLTPAG